MASIAWYAANIVKEEMKESVKKLDSTSLFPSPSGSD